jgi:excisionase family DNA binding protein
MASTSHDLISEVRTTLIVALRGAADAIEAMPVAKRAVSQPSSDRREETVPFADDDIATAPRANPDYGTTTLRGDKRVYSVKEVADALQLHRSTAYELVRRGEIRAVQVGGRKLVPAAELDRLLGH